MTLGVRGLYEVDQTVFVGVRVEQNWSWAICKWATARC